MNPKLLDYTPRIPSVPTTSDSWTVNERIDVEVTCLTLSVLCPSSFRSVYTGTCPRQMDTRKVYTLYMLDLETTEPSRGQFRSTVCLCVWPERLSIKHIDILRQSCR